MLVIFALFTGTWFPVDLSASCSGCAAGNWGSVANPDLQFRQAVLAPTFAAHLIPYIQLPSGIGELSFCLWLLVMGVSIQRWAEKANAAEASLHA